MKKALLLAATTLLAASAAWAETRYFADGDPVPATTDLTDGMYFLTVYRQSNNQSGVIQYYKDAIGGYAAEQIQWNPYGASTINEQGVDVNNVWNIAFPENGRGFTLQTVNSDAVYASCMGRVNIGRNNIWTTVNGTDKGQGNVKDKVRGIAQLAIEDVPTHYVAENDIKRFFVKLVNAYTDEVANPDTYDDEGKSISYLFSNASGGLGNVVNYYPTATPGADCIQVAFIPAKAIDSRKATITLPAQLGTGTMTREIDVFDGISAESYINDLINELGGMTDVVIKSSADDNSLIVSETNVNFTVEGNWMADFEANNVYRLCVNPSDNPSALRYMLDAKQIRTKIDGMETLSRLIPERLWYFVKTDDGDDTYTMHNLYNRNAAVHFEGTDNGAVASYTEDQTATVFQMIPTAQHNQFYLKINGTENAYVSDNGGNGVFTINNIATPDENCLIQFYPLENRDMEALQLATNLERTVDNVKDAVEAYNAQNIAAAIRRIEYWGGEQLVGWQPGRFNNKAGDFHIKLQEAKNLLESGSTDEDALKAAVEAISFEKLTVFNKIKPGMFYRFKNKMSGMYMSSIPYNANYMELVTSAGATRSNTVFYVDGPEDGPYTIVSFDTGLVLPKFEGGKTPWLPVVNGTDKASNQYQIVHEHLGGCILHSVGTGNTHRHLHGGNNSSPKGAVLAAGADKTDDYQWYVELVEELPVPLYNTDDNTQAWASVYSPVALQIQNGEAVAHTGKFNGTHVEKTKHGDGTTIPANTSVLLDYKGGAEGSDRRDNMSYIYLKVLYPTNEAEAALYYDGDTDTEVTTPTSPELKELNGGIYAVTKAAGTKYFSLHETTTNNFREHSTESTYIPGFKAHIAIAENELPEKTTDNTDSEGNLILPIKDSVDDTTGISEVATEGVKAVYDLQGRRLAAPAKGINIINGKKVLVK